MSLKKKNGWISPAYSLPKDGEEVEVIYQSRGPNDRTTWIVIWPNIEAEIRAWRHNESGFPVGPRISRFPEG